MTENIYHEARRRKVFTTEITEYTEKSSFNHESTKVRKHENTKTRKHENTKTRKHEKRKSNCNYWIKTKNQQYKASFRRGV
ncbi:MAG: hypothetical protein SRB1_00213 [Desulfobacteraceae bacterium Eth-SRB1]|nr:MAG: hypothetical protein SRB1_00213 [Desulfobacteraceae bacterium Eth-SRB1]